MDDEPLREWVDRTSEAAGMTRAEEAAVEEAAAGGGTGDVDGDDDGGVRSGRRGRDGAGEGSVVGRGPVMMRLISSYRIVSYRRAFESGVVHSVLTYASTWKYSGLTESKPNLRHLRSLGLA